MGPENDNGLALLTEQIGTRVRRALPHGVNFLLVVFRTSVDDPEGLYVVNSTTRKEARARLQECLDYLDAQSTTARSDA